MASLTFQLPDSTEMCCELEESSLTIGRGKDNDIPLPFESVSTNHAAIEFVGGHFTLTDLGSTNGFKANGKKMTERVLEDGDKLAIGGIKAFFSEEDDPDLAGVFDEDKGSSKDKEEKEEEKEEDEGPVLVSKGSSGADRIAGSSFRGTSASLSRNTDAELDTTFFVLVGLAAIAAILVGLTLRHYAETDGFFLSDWYEKVRYIKVSSGAAE